MTSCNDTDNREDLLGKLPNPYNLVLDDSKIIAFLGTEKSGRYDNDTLYLDNAGRIVKRNYEYSITRWEYDSNNYKTRLMHESDYFSNYLISHQLKRDTLYEYWYPLKSPVWEYQESDIDSNRVSIDKYLLDRGMPIKFIDSDGSYDNYYYNDTNQIVKIDRYSKSGELGVEVSYKYDGGKLKEVATKHVDGKFYETIYFSDGLLDSIVDIDFNRKYTVLEKYPD